MANTDPLTDFSVLISENISVYPQISLQSPPQSDEYLKELELNNFQTRQLFDELLEEEDSPNFISQFQKDQRILNQQNATSITDIPHMAYIEVQKTRKIFKQKKAIKNSSTQSVHFGLVPREKQKHVAKMAHSRPRFRIQQNDQQQKPIQTTQQKSKSRDKINECQVQVLTKTTNQSCYQLCSEGKLFNWEQFQNYLSLS